jgi:hypothetical protein
MNKIGLLVEGAIDEALLPPLIQDALGRLSQAAPLTTMTFPYPPGGFGEVVKNLKTLVRLYQNLSERERLGCNLFLIVHDSRKTESIQKEIRTILREAVYFPAVYGLAIQETEAWVLGDIGHVNRHVFQIHPDPRLPRAPELDPDPKKTLTDLYVKPSKTIEYDCWNLACACQVAPFIRSSQVARRCPRGFGKLVSSLSRNRKRLVSR